MSVVNVGKTIYGIHFLTNRLREAPKKTLEKTQEFFIYVSSLNSVT